MQWYDIVCQIGQAVTGLGDWGRRVDARLDRLREDQGIPAWVPEVKEREVDDKMREAIIAARGNMPAAVWLRDGGPRDAICERFGLTPEQVAGVLAGETGRTNGHGRTSAEDKPAEETGDPSGAGGLRVVKKITHDPATWPTREPKGRGSKADVAPKRGHKEYEINDEDRLIVIAVLEHTPENWNEVRHQIALKRRLLGQQLGKLKQLHTQGKLGVQAA